MSDVSASLGSLDYLDPVLPGDAIVQAFELHNTGDEVLPAGIVIKLYASSDGTLDAGDAEVGGVVTEQGMSAGEVQQVSTTLSFATLAPGPYRLIVHADADGGIAEPNESDNVAVSSDVFDLDWRFGQVTDHTGSQALTVLDADGSQVSFTLSGNGTGRVTSTAMGFDLVLSGTDAGTSLAIAVAEGDGRTRLHDVEIAGDLNLLTAPLADLNGDIAISGAIRNLTFGDISAPSTITLGAAAVGGTNFTARDVTDLVFESASPINLLSVRNWSDADAIADRITAPALQRLIVQGDFEASLQLTGLSTAPLVLMNAQIGGVIGAGHWNLHGRAGQVSAGSTSDAWKASFTGPVASLITTGDMSGQFAAPSLGVLQSGGDLRNARILIGATLGADGMLGGVDDDADTFSVGNLPRVRVGGDVLDSRIWVGIDPVDGIFDNGNDRLAPGLGGQIREIGVGGALSALSAISAKLLPVITRVDQASVAASSLPQLITMPVDRVAPTISAGLASDTGSAANDGITRDVTIAGSIHEFSPIASFKAGLNGVPQASYTDVRSTLNPDGTFTFSEALLDTLASGQLADGLHNLQLIATDASGNTSSITEVTFTLDTAPPNVSLDLAEAYNTAPLGDHETELELVTLAGLSDAHASVRLSDPARTSTAGPTGAFSFAAVPLRVGANGFEVEVTDRAGNTTVFQRIITRVPASDEALLISEGDRLVTRIAQTVALGQAEGSRVLRIGLAPQFDKSTAGGLLEDLFQIYLVDPSDLGATLLDRGTPGTALFSWDGANAEYLPGLVTFDGAVVTIDVTSLKDLSEGLLVFQLLNHDADSGSRVEIVSIDNVVDPDGVASPVFPMRLALASAAGDIDVTNMTLSTDVQVLVENVRLDPAIGLYTADIRVRNDGTPIGRNVVVLFPGLPSGVSLVDPSGIDASGTPYLNFRNAVPAGGLEAQASSQPIRVSFADPSLVRFVLSPQVRVGGPNQAPVFDPIGPLTVRPGGVLEVPLIATDPDGDAITFSLVTDQALPSTVLKANGQLRFNPALGQEGTYQFTLIASDGSATTDQAVTLTVAADPVTTTRISGRILATDGMPIAGVPIVLSRLTVMTDAEGRFTLEIPHHLIPTEDLSLIIPIGDPHFDPFGTGTQTISFRRAGFDTTTGTDTSNPRAHMNLVTGYIDASMVYGSDEARARALRTLVGGQLKTSPGDLLPLNNESYFADGMLENDVQGLADPTMMFVAGDVRVSENVALAAIHTVLLREHNRLAAEYAAADPTLSDEALYQRAR